MLINEQDEEKELLDENAEDEEFYTIDDHNIEDHITIIGAK